MKIDSMKKNDCCGCRACEQACPKDAIKMVADREGYKYPVINGELCIRCGICEKVCGFEDKSLENKDKDNQKYYWVKNKNLEDRMRSRSGGFFFIVAQWILNQNGAVYGSILDDNNHVKHIRAVDIDNCKKMQGSKYVESDISNVYSQVKRDLADGMKVLFSGTACQVAGLYGFLQNHPHLNELYTIDIVCHGVCSARILEDYIKFWEKKKKGKISEFNFRDKTKTGWDSHIESFVINNKKYYRNNYTRLFYCKNAMRPSCSECRFAKVERVGDFSLADFWGAKKYFPEQQDNKGISSVFVNTDKAKSLFDSLAEKMNYGEASEESIMQPNLKRPTPAGDNREEFWKLYEEKGFLALLKKYGGYDIFRRIKWFFETGRTLH